MEILTCVISIQKTRTDEISDPLKPRFGNGVGLTADLECKAGAQRAYRNRHSNFIFIPDGESTKPRSHMSTRIVDEIDVHANDDQQRRACEAQVSK